MKINSVVEYAVCQNCLLVLANDDRSGMEDAEIAATDSGLSEMYLEYAHVVPDGSELGFSYLRCDCCGSLPGDRFKVLCFEE